MLHRGRAMCFSSSSSCCCCCGDRPESISCWRTFALVYFGISVPLLIGLVVLAMWYALTLFQEAHNSEAVALLLSTAGFFLLHYIPYVVALYRVQRLSSPLSSTYEDTPLVSHLYPRPGYVRQGDAGAR